MSLDTWPHAHETILLVGRASDSDRYPYVATSVAPQRPRWVTQWSTRGTLRARLVWVVGATVLTAGACLPTSGSAPQAVPAPVVWNLDVAADGEVALNGRTMTQADLAVIGRRQRPVEANVRGPAEARCDDVLSAVAFARTAGARRVTPLSPDGRPVTRVAAYPASDGTPMEVRVAADGTMRLALVQADVAAVLAALRDRITSGRNAHVRILVDGASIYGRVTALAAALQDVGARWIGVALDTHGSSASLPAEVGPSGASPARILMQTDSVGAVVPDEVFEREINASVRVAVTVEADGRISAARALDDPGHGLARAAERALLNHATATPARDSDGHPARSVVPFTVRFAINGAAH